MLLKQFFNLSDPEIEESKAGVLVRTESGENWMMTVDSFLKEHGLKSMEHVQAKNFKGLPFRGLYVETIPIKGSRKF